MGRINRARGMKKASKLKVFDLCASVLDLELLSR